MSTLTGANAIFMLSIPGVYSTPQQLQGFASDDSFATQSIKRAEVLMGVDGVLSGGFIFVVIPQTIDLQGDSASNDIFDQWDAANQAQIDSLTANGVVLLPGIGRKWTLTKGFLTDFEPIPAVKRLVQPRKFGITWGSMVVAPI